MPGWSRAITLATEGAFGDILEIRVSSMLDVLEQGTHLLDLALRVGAAAGLPAPDWVVAGAAGIKRYGAIPVPVDLLLEAGLGNARLLASFGDNAPRIMSSTDTWRHMLLEVIGTQATYRVPLFGEATLVRNGSVESMPTDYLRDDVIGQAAFYTALRDAILGGAAQSFPTRVGEASRVPAFQFAAYAAATRRTRLPLPHPAGAEVLNDLAIAFGG
jgi:hypothetical protein